MPFSNSDYRALAAFRYELRKFLAFSEEAARSVGLEPQQHQLLLAVRGLPRELRPTIGVIAERLCVRHHTAVALVDKLEAHELLMRERSTEDRREVFLRLTERGETVLRDLSKLHRDQLRNVAPTMVQTLQAILGLSAVESSAQATLESASLIAPAVRASASGPCASETKPASNCDGGQ